MQAGTTNPLMDVLGSWAGSVLPAIRDIAINMNIHLFIPAANVIRIWGKCTQNKII
jgi:hypothetical protein